MLSEDRMALIGTEEHFLTPDAEAAWHAVGLEATACSTGYHAGVIG